MWAKLSKYIFYLNSIGESVTGGNWWWTMSPSRASGGSTATIFHVYGSNAPGHLSDGYVNYSCEVRPVISLKQEVLVSEGNGTSENPYIVIL